MREVPFDSILRWPSAMKSQMGIKGAHPVTHLSSVAHTTFPQQDALQPELRVLRGEYLFGDAGVQTVTIGNGASVFLTGLPAPANQQASQRIMVIQSGVLTLNNDAVARVGQAWVSIAAVGAVSNRSFPLDARLTSQDIAHLYLQQIVAGGSAPVNPVYLETFTTPASGFARVQVVPYPLVILQGFQASFVIEFSTNVAANVIAGWGVQGYELTLDPAELLSFKP